MLRSAQNLYLQTNPWLYLKDTILVCKHILTVDEGTVVPFHHVRVNLFPHGPIRLTYRAMFRWLSHAYAISLILLMDTTLHPLGGSKTRCCNWVHFLIQYSHHIDWFRILSINHTALCNILRSVPSHRADFSVHHLMSSDDVQPILWCFANLIRRLFHRNSLTKLKPPSKAVVGEVGPLVALRLPNFVSLDPEVAPRTCQNKFAPKKGESDLWKLQIVKNGRFFFQDLKS